MPFKIKFAIGDLDLSIPMLRREWCQLSALSFEFLGTLSTGVACRVSSLVTFVLRS